MSDRLEAVRLDSYAMAIRTLNGGLRIHQCEFAEEGVLFPERSIWLDSDAAKALLLFMTETAK